jgi:hypothetical protein
MANLHNLICSVSRQVRSQTPSRHFLKFVFPVPAVLRSNSLNLVLFQLAAPNFTVAAKVNGAPPTVVNASSNGASLDGKSKVFYVSVHLIGRNCVY